MPRAVFLSVDLKVFASALALIQPLGDLFNCELKGVLYFAAAGGAFKISSILDFPCPKPKKRAIELRLWRKWDFPVLNLPAAFLRIHHVLLRRLINFVESQL